MTDLPPPPPWQAERVVGADLAAHLITTQFPALQPARLTLLGTGWDNTVFLVNETWVFRFPRRQIAAGLIATEARALPRLAPKLPLPVPLPTWMGQPTDSYPWPFAGYRYLAGTPATSVSLTTAQRTAAAQRLGRFLRALHDASHPDLGLPGDTLNRLNMESRRSEWATRLTSLRRRGFIDDERVLIDQFDRHMVSPPITTTPGVPVHGDLYAGQILVDSEGEPSAVIDWGDLHSGHPAVDLALMHSFFPPAARTAFHTAYGPVDPVTDRLAWTRAMYHTVMVVAYGADVGREDLLGEGLGALQRMGQRPPETRG